MNTTIKFNNVEEEQAFVAKVERLKADGHDIDLADIPAAFGTSLFADPNKHELALMDSEYYRQWTLQDFVNEIEFANGKPRTTKDMYAAADESRANIYAHLMCPLVRFGKLMTDVAAKYEADLSIVLLAHLFDTKIFDTIEILKSKTYDELFAAKLVEDQDDPNLCCAEPTGELALVSEMINSERLPEILENDDELLPFFADSYGDLNAMFKYIDKSYQAYNQRKGCA